MYRTIAASFWTDPKVRQISPEAKLLLLYLITNPHTHVSGIYVLPTIMIQHETGLSKSKLDTLSHTLSSAGFCAFDEGKDVIWVRKMMAYQGKGEKNQKSAAAHVAEDLHNSYLCKEFLDAYPEVRQWVKPSFIDTLSTKVSGLRTPDPDPDPDSEQNPDPEIKTISSAGADSSGPKYSAEFDQFWRSSTKRGSKLEAFRVWQSLKPNPTLIAAITAGHVAWQASGQWQDESKQPHVFRWLKRRGWEEVVPKPLFGERHGTRLENSNGTETPGASSGRTSRGDPKYIPKQ